MTLLQVLTYLVYLVSGVTFILALKFLSSPRTARTGNLLGAAGMALAVIFAMMPSYLLSRTLVTTMMQHMLPAELQQIFAATPTMRLAKPDEPGAEEAAAEKTVTRWFRRRQDSRQKARCDSRA